MSFWDLLKPPAATKAKTSAKPVTSAELAAALAEAEAEATRAEAAAGEVAGRRATMLLSADDAALDQIERELQLATRAADKAAMAVETLRSKLAAAQEAERISGLDAIFAEGQAALDAGLALYREYAGLAARLAVIAEGMADRCDEIEAANAKLVKAGDARRIADLDTTARPEVSDIRQLRLAMWHQLKVPGTTGPHDFLWPAITEPRIRHPLSRRPLDGAEPPPPARQPGVVR